MPPSASTRFSAATPSAPQNLAHFDPNGSERHPSCAISSVHPWISSGLVSFATGSLTGLRAAARSFAAAASLAPRAATSSAVSRRAIASSFFSSAAMAALILLMLPLAAIARARRADARRTRATSSSDAASARFSAASCSALPASADASRASPSATRACCSFASATSSSWATTCCLFITSMPAAAWTRLPTSATAFARRCTSPVPWSLCSRLSLRISSFRESAVSTSFESSEVIVWLSSSVSSLASPLASATADA
mmetsp:Transcript_49685/g.113163  ORF Transcript_49685/g.113163 Transcript_49685/m.113163 type:complete len:255 (+) Transcript_49685:626-1390(+)